MKNLFELAEFLRLNPDHLRRAIRNKYQDIPHTKVKHTHGMRKYFDPAQVIEYFNVKFKR